VQLTFYKYQGTGNDFIMIDNRAGDIALSVPQIEHLCNRKFGIGSDGIVLIESDAAEDFYMNFYNPDGSKSFCGNGARAAVAFAQSLGIIDQDVTFLAIDVTTSS
jgi:diaminopimelate epimerase